MNIESLIHKFFDYIYAESIELYNEFSLQHELGIFLRHNLTGLKVEFERNVEYFGLDKSELEKKEIDICIYHTLHSKFGCAIEVKYPRNGQYPETMYSFCKDISFIEQLQKRGFQNSYFLALVDDKNFYEGKDNGIYGFFRAKKPIHGCIVKPTGKKDSQIEVYGTYLAKWNEMRDGRKYCLISA